MPTLTKPSRDDAKRTLSATRAERKVFSWRKCIGFAALKRENDQRED
jgi:hypothetical protein